MPDPVASFLHEGFRRMVRRGLRGVWLRGTLPPGPFVWAANHHSWWDPFLAAVLLRHRACLIMEQDNIQRYAFMRRLGVFGTAEHRTGLRLIDSGRVLVIYPEAALQPAGPLHDLADGAAWYAHRAHVPLYAVAVRLALRGHQAPEAYVSILPVELGSSVRDSTRRLAKILGDDLSSVDGLLRSTDPRSPLPGFRRAYAGRRSWDERIDALQGRRS